jgi:hypothetical protein
MQLSADLDDYNWQHELWELEEMWYSRAHAYWALGDAASMERGNSASLIASGFARSVVLVHGEPFRVYIGMYSGQRGTTWDNTSKHEIDRGLAVAAVCALGLQCEQYHVTESGDDEWLMTASWREAANYIQVCKMMGLRMNSKKQLVGKEHGEYLQRCISGDTTPRQSLCALLGTLCTGNWYRPMGTWLNSVLESCCANWVEATARGLRRSVAARMCGMLLDQLMVVHEPDGVRELNWRQHVLFHKDGETLFGGIDGFNGLVPPDLVVRPRCRPNWMSHGVSDYLLTPEAQWIRRSLKKDWLEKQFMEGVAADTHGSCEQVYERERSSRLVAERWETGGVYVEVPMGLTELPPGPGLRDTVKAWHAAKQSGRAVTMEDNMAAMGLGGREMQLLGGYEQLLRTAPPHLLARVKPLAAGPEMSHRCGADINILAGLMVHQAQHPEFGLRKEGAQRHITVVAAMHGAGMSRLARRFQQKDVMRFDRAARTVRGEEAYHRPTADTEWDMRVYKRVALSLASKLASGWRPGLKVLLTHEHPEMIVSALKTVGFTAHWVLYSPDQAEIARRIAARNLCAGVLRYMQRVWCALYEEKSPADELRTEEEVIQMVRAVKCR